MEPANIYESIPAQLPEELFEVLLQNDKIRIERILSKGHTSPDSGWYDQDHNEWVLVLKGAATIELEGKDKLRLTAGDYLNIPAHARHKVAWTVPETETVWLAVHY